MSATGRSVSVHAQTPPSIMQCTLKGY